MSTIDRTWFSGLSSGLDTQSLIDKIMKAERAPLDKLEQKVSTLTYQKTMLQEINLKLYELQNKAADLVFSKTFNSKSVASTDESVLSATANTSAKVGSYSLQVKQLATSTKATSSSRLAAPLELGWNIKSTDTLGGRNVTLGSLGITTPGALDVTVSGGVTHTLALGLTSASTVEDMVSATNTAISGVAELSGKLLASYDEKENKIRFDLLDSSKTITIVDQPAGADEIVEKLFGSPTGIKLDKNAIVKKSNQAIRAGGDTQLSDIGIEMASTFSITRDASTLTLDLTALSSTSTVQEMVDELNGQIDGFGSFNEKGVPTGNPDDRLLEFRFDENSQKLLLVNTNTADTEPFLFDKVAGNFVETLFGVASPGSSFDGGKKIANETFPSTISSGTFTVDGVQMTLTNSSDTIQDIMARITSATGVIAKYDSATDKITLTRKDGSSNPIGLGSASDTSNFLSVTGLISGVQGPSAASSESTGTLALTAGQAQSVLLKDLAGISPLFPAGGTGKVKVTVGGTSTEIDYNADTDTLNSVLGKIRNVSGIDKAYYDSDTGKVVITTEATGSGASLKLEDTAGGTFTQSFLVSNATTTGLDTGPTLETSRPISGVQTAASLDKGGFATAITSGSFTINGVAFRINDTSTMTLSTLMDNINGNTKAGVKAEYDASQGKLILSSKATGNTAISIGSPSDTSNFLAAVGLTSASQEVGKNAIFNVKGMYGDADQVRQSNQISDVVDGVTFTLKDVTNASGETVTISADTTTARKAIDDFITSYNEIMDTIYTRLNEEHDYTLDPLTSDQEKDLSDEEIADYEEEYKKGLLAGDSTLSSVRSRMRVVMSGIVGSLDKTFDALSDIGITTGEIGSGYQDTQVGKLKITDQDKLTAALRDSPDLVSKLFGNSSDTESQKGIARRLKETLNEFTKSDGLLTKRVGRSGLSTSNSEMDTQISYINDQISRQEERLNSKEEALIKQFANLETALQKYQNQANSFASQLAQLTGSSSS